MAGNTDGYVHSLMLAIEKQRSLNNNNNNGKYGKQSLIDLNQFNAQYNASLLNNNNNDSSSSFTNDQQLF